ncbi:MAG: hypothetical protein AAB225_26650 [Acidobacteriota bacterium]
MGSNTRLPHLINYNVSRPVDNVTAAVRIPGLKVYDLVLLRMKKL